MNIEPLEITLKSADGPKLYAPANFDEDLMLVRVDNVRRLLQKYSPHELFIENPSVFQDGALLTFISMRNQRFSLDNQGVYFSRFGNFYSIVGDDDSRWKPLVAKIKILAENQDFCFLERNILNSTKYSGQHEALSGESWWGRFFAEAF